jgi:hypothetical protein
MNRVHRILIDDVFFCQNPVENCTQIFLRFDVNRYKSDVMTSFGMIDWSDVCRVFGQAGSSKMYVNTAQEIEPVNSVLAFFNIGNQFPPSRFFYERLLEKVANYLSQENPEKSG